MAGICKFFCAMLLFSAMSLVVNFAEARGSGFLDGNEFYEKCNEDELFCIAYVIGNIDAVKLFQDLGSITHGRSFCIPGGVSAVQVTDVVRKFLEDTPQHRHLDASLLIARSLRVAFPCS